LIQQQINNNVQKVYNLLEQIVQIQNANRVAPDLLATTSAP